MGKIYSVSDDFAPINALPVEELFEEDEDRMTLFVNLCIEYGRKLALEDFVMAAKYSLDKNEVRAILGMEEEEKNE